MFGKQVDMIFNEHDIADLKVFVHASGCIADKECMYTQCFHYSYRKGDFLHIIAFVIVKTTGHHHYLLVSDGSEDQFTGMTFYSRLREVWNYGVWQFFGNGYGFGKSPQTAAQDDAIFRQCSQL
ncbi:hypothetical protein D3C72_1505770 [compost metagenome]